MTVSLLSPVRHIVRVTLEAVTPLSIGSGEADRDLDAPLFRDWNGLPCLSGTAIAGVLRSLYVDHYCEAEAKALFGHQTPGADGGSASGLLVSFGLVLDATGRAVDGRVTAAEIQADAVLKLLADPAPIKREHVAIDGTTGAAKDTGKFDRTAVPVGTRFALELAIDGGDAERDRLFEVVRLLKSPLLRLGGSGRRGAGKVSVARRRYLKLDRTGAAGRLAWLAYRGSKLDDAPTKAINGGPVWKNEPAWDPLPISARAPVTGTLALTAKGAWRMGTGRTPWGTLERPPAASPLLEPVIEWPKDGRVGPATILTARRTPVPASGIKGALAHRTEFHLRRLRGCKPEPAGRRADDLFGSINSAGGGKAGAVSIDDAWFDYGGGPLREQTRNSIDRHVGGVRNGVLFTDEALWQGPTLSIAVTVHEVIDEDVLRAFDWALEDLCNGALALGAGDAIGDGVFTGAMTWDDDRAACVARHRPRVSGGGGMTGSLDQLCADWADLSGSTALKDLDTPPLTDVILERKSDAFETLTAIEAAIATYETEWTGWLRRESDVYRTPHASALKAGAPLDGEWVSADKTRTVRLLHDGRAWRLITLTEGAADGEPVLREDSKLLAGDGGPGPLTYAVYWGRPTPDAPITRLAYRFTGFGKGG